MLRYAIEFLVIVATVGLLGYEGKNRIPDSDRKPD